MSRNNRRPTSHHNKTRPINQRNLPGPHPPRLVSGLRRFLRSRRAPNRAVRPRPQPHQVCVISGIGCSSNLPGYVNTYGMHTLHGRSLAVATGVKLGEPRTESHLHRRRRRRLTASAAITFVHTMRRNVDLTYIVMDNQIYGLTTGQVLAHQRQGHENQEHALRQRGEPDQPDPDGDCRRRDLRGPRLQRQTETHGRNVQGRDSAQRLRPRGCVQSLRHLQQGQHLPVVQPAREDAWRNRATTRPICTRRSIAATNGATRFRSASSGAAPTCRHWKSWSPCCTPAKARWPFAANRHLRRSRRKRW